MSNILQIGYTAEGSTDERFLGNIIRKTFEAIASDCKSPIEVYQPEFLKKEEHSFVDQIVSLAKKYAYFHVICIHCDADAPTLENGMRNKFNPMFDAVRKADEGICKNLVPVIPVQMTEAWMLADTELLKNKIGTQKSENELGLPMKANLIENINDPKATIVNALKIAYADQPKRRRKRDIADLYTPISQELSLEKLRFLASFNAFELKAREALQILNYLD